MTLNNYDLNARFGTHTIKVSLQTGNYKGYVTYQIGGNMKGANLLDTDGDSLYSHNYKDNQAKLKNLDDDWFSMSLVASNGDSILIEEEWDYIENYIVGVEIIAFEPE